MRTEQEQQWKRQYATQRNFHRMIFMRTNLHPYICTSKTPQNTHMDYVVKKVLEVQQGIQ